MLHLLIAAAAMRIISLAPSLTENLFAIGAGPQVVAVDSYSNYPAAAKRLPHIGAMVGVSVERIIALRPTLVVGIAYQAPLLRQLQRYGIRTAMNDADTLDQVYATLLRYGDATGHAREARRVVDTMHAQIDTLTRRANKLPRRSSFVVISTSPIYTAGGTTFLAELLADAHLRNISQHAGRSPWPEYAAEALMVQAPETLVTSVDLQLPQTSPWSQLPAVRRDCVFRLDADAMLRPGPRFVETLRNLVEAREKRPQC